MGDLLIHNVKVLDPGRGVVADSIRVQDGKIAQLGTHDAGGDGQQIDGGGRLLTPGLIDVHVHGMSHAFAPLPVSRLDGIHARSVPSLATHAT